MFVYTTGKDGGGKCDEKMKLGTYDMVTVAVLAAMLGIISQISIPMPVGVPFTLQTFAISFMGVVVGYKRGVISYLIWMFLGLVGVPVFAQLSGGAGTIFGLTGGFLFGFFFLVLCSGIASKSSNKGAAMILMLLGLAATHVLGIVQFSFLTGTEFQKTFLLVSFPYLLKDVISLVAALVVGTTVRKRIKKEEHWSMGKI